MADGDFHLQVLPDDHPHSHHQQQQQRTAAAQAQHHRSYGAASAQRYDHQKSLLQPATNSGGGGGDDDAFFHSGEDDAEDDDGAPGRFLKRRRDGEVNGKCGCGSELHLHPHPHGQRGRSAATVSSAGDSYRKDREEWSEEAINSLLDAYTDRFEQLNRGNLRGRDWEDVAAIVSESCDKNKPGKCVEQCKNKIDNLKKRYKVECQRLSAGGLPSSTWPWFKKMEQIVAAAAASKIEDDKSGSSSKQTSSAKRYQTGTPGQVAANHFKLSQCPSRKWKRVLLKISGSTLAGAPPQNVDPKIIMLIAKEIQIASLNGVEVAVVVGGRNIFSTDSWAAATGTDKSTTYHIGMMASVMNAVLLQASLEKIGVDTRVQTALMMQEIAEPYIRRRAIGHLEKRRVVIFGGLCAGVGIPPFTTDTAAALRASEINADVVMKGLTGDSLYGCPGENSGGMHEHISFRELVLRGYTGIDLTAVTLCEENNIPIVLFNVLETGNISRALCGDQVGTLVDQSGGIS